MEHIAGGVSEGTLAPLLKKHLGISTPDEVLHGLFTSSSRQPGTHREV